MHASVAVQPNLQAARDSVDGNVLLLPVYAIEGRLPCTKRFGQVRQAAAIRSAHMVLLSISR